MPYQNGVRYLNEVGVTAPTGDGFPTAVILDIYQLDANGEKIITGLTGADLDTTIYTLTPATLPEDGSLFVFAATSTTVTIRSTAGSGHANIFFKFKMEKFA